MNLPEYLDKFDISIRQFARAAGLSRTTIRRIRDGYPYCLDTAEKIIRASRYHIHIDDLMRYHEKKGKKNDV